ncbi:4Fe-4S dicluster domain-containing protein [Flavobacteriaceae bacterium R38]|nr:4Fe-4S dicluster domain-containing protein [Flavobacteriaceae bacterium R38]
MKNQKHIIVNGNEATAHIAYRVNELCTIYPITPSSEMSELVEMWSSNQQQNIFGDVPVTFEMQSEAGVAGAMHGALQTGSLVTTFTASQGLLLMMPNMYKIAGELTPNVIHVATRSIATHALSVFGDHSDIMAVRNTGYAFLGAASVQEAHDFALIAQAATLASRIPFVHFFDGFRTSHEISKIELISDEIISAMINKNLVRKHRENALNPNNPVIRGTSQGPDVFFQSREAVNSFYDRCPGIVQDQMDLFANLTGRQYKLFDYVGHSEAEQVIVSMASSVETIEETVHHLNSRGEKTGLIKVRLFRPFSSKHLINALPESCKSIAVLDRTKEPGGTGEPLYLDVLQSLLSERERFDRFPKVVGGRYGLSSKEFTPGMVKGIIKNLKQEQPKNNFTIGINDDITNLSLEYSNDFQFQNKYYQAQFYELKSDKTQISFNNVLQLFNDKPHNYVQGYIECDYKKFDALSVAHMRIASKPVKAPYLISDADFIACNKISDVILQNLKSRGTLLVDSSLNASSFWEMLPMVHQEIIQEKKIQLHIVNTKELAESYLVKTYAISALHTCFLILKNRIDDCEIFSEIKQAIKEVGITTAKEEKTPAIDLKTTFADTLLGKLMDGKGNDFPVSALPVDGTFLNNTSKFNPPRGGIELPEWNTDLCVQCGACSMACPQASLRIKAYNDNYLSKAPSTLKSVKSIEPDWDIDLLNYTIQIHPEHCTSCNNCVDACPVKALKMTDKSSVIAIEKKNWDYFESIPELDRSKIDNTKVSQQQLQEPLFKYAMGVDGCGEAPYLKLLSQLFGDRALIANATGASSIFGGALPTTPWSENKKGRGPAWSNSLFEDNAEFGLGYRLSIDHQYKQAQSLLKKLMNRLNFDLVYNIINAKQKTEQQVNEQRTRIEQLKIELKKINSSNANQLLSIVDNLVKKSIWIVGGDGWAYDIGYGGLDHVIASGKNVNILVLDNEVYSNTGGQMSKATPFGAMAKFAADGKQKQKKDLGLLAMTYSDVYVASVAIGADQEQTLKAFIEAEQYDGPSIIIAYSHSPSHGIDMKNPGQYHKAAVNSGQWLLYRNNPERIEKELNPLQLDSDKPSIKIVEYLKMEKRFVKLFEQDRTAFENLMKQLQHQVDKRFDTYLRNSASELIHKNYEGITG